MTLHELIGKGKLEKFKKPSFAELNDKLKLVYAHLKTAEILLNDESLEALFTRAQRMSKNRNKIDYDIKMFDISDASIKQSLKDGKKLLNRVNKEIESKNPQGKLNL